jgi:hypothetical protein
MSELFAIRVFEVSDKSASMRVYSVHPDSGPRAPHAVFALMLMYDPIAKSGDAEFKEYRHLDNSPLAQAMDASNAFNSEWMNANARAFVEKVKVSGAVLKIKPTHPAWLEHLREGMWWRTAAYDAGPGLPAAPRAPKGAPPRRSQDPAAGFRVGRPASRSGAEKSAKASRSTTSGSAKKRSAEAVSPAKKTASRGVPKVASAATKPTKPTSARGARKAASASKTKPAIRGGTKKSTTLASAGRPKQTASARTAGESARPTSRSRRPAR